MANVGYVFVSETEPDAEAVSVVFSTGIAGEKLWFKPSVGKQFKWTGSAWVEIIEPVDRGDVNFIGSVSADGKEGLTGQRTVGGYIFTFEKGILVGFQAE